ncbi:MAG: hypothetical protein IPN89_04450 [Saprospiraceae bacterium]|nr:hypothetical protein [Saprospiraceae bacterium]MBL0099026.1 hypothetical protein [Saprospiraceae bacterium]
MEIRKLLIISTFICALSSCVDVLPIPSVDEGMKLFVVCEMQMGENVNAKISYTGNANGTQPQMLMMPDTFNFSIAEGEKDFGVPFRYNARDTSFNIDKNNLSIKVGEKYKFRGVGSNTNTSEPYLTVPESLQVDSLTIKNVKSGIVSGMHFTEVSCEISFKKPSTTKSYFYLVPKNEHGMIWEVSAFDQDHNAFKKLKNRDGFLVDYSRLESDVIKLTLTLSEPLDYKYLDFNVFNVTESFYRYNHFISNTYTDPGQSSENQAIAAFNIRTPKAYGSFSALTNKKIIKKIKD